MEKEELEKVPRKPGLREQVCLLLDLPADGAAGLPKLELTSDRDLYLVNYQGILSYGQEEIHVDSGAWVLRIQGRDLELKAMREGELRIGGCITRLEIL